MAAQPPAGGPPLGPPPGAPAQPAVVLNVVAAQPAAQQAAAPVQPPAPVQPHAPPAGQGPAPFMLAPNIHGAVPLDYRLVENVKFYNKSITPVEPKFDLGSHGLKVFLASLEHRAMSTAWDFNIPKDMANPQDTYNILHEYGLITYEQVHAHVASYNNTQTRAAQESTMLFLCIMASLTEEGKTHMVLFKDQYVINGIPAGMALLKLVISESYIDTNATTRVVRERLSNLDTYMVEIKSDVEKFNLYVKDQRNSLDARGQTTDDLLHNLLKGYSAASDREFKAYIKKKQDDSDEGQALDVNRLMQLALTKYQLLKESGRWNAKTEEETKIIALEAQIKKLAKKPADGKAPKARKANSGKATNDQTPSSTKQTDGTKSKPAWMTTKPKQGKPTKKMVGDKEFRWCTKHEAWGRHKPQDCEGKGVKRSDLNTNKAKAADKEKKAQALKLSKALLSIVEQDDDDGSESE